MSLSLELLVLETESVGLNLNSLVIAFELHNVSL